MTPPRFASGELAAALACLNEEFGKLPPAAQDHAAAQWGAFDAALEDNCEMEFDAIRCWEQRHLALFAEARRDAEVSP
jgi:hypothetical protein